MAAVIILALKSYAKRKRHGASMSVNKILKYELLSQKIRKNANYDIRK